MGEETSEEDEKAAEKERAADAEREDSGLGLRRRRKQTKSVEDEDDDADADDEKTKKAKLKRPRQMRPKLKTDSLDNLFRLVWAYVSAFFAFIFDAIVFFSPSTKSRYRAWGEGSGKRQNAVQFKPEDLTESEFNDFVNSFRTELLKEQEQKRNEKHSSGWRRKNAQLLGGKRSEDKKRI